MNEQHRAAQTANDPIDYRLLVENCNEGIYRFDTGGVLVYVNRRGADLLGYAVEEMLGRPFADFHLDADLPEARRNFADRMRGMGGVSEYRLRRKDGSHAWFAVSSMPVLDAGGACLGLIGYGRNIDEQKRNEAIRAQELRLLRRIAGDAPLAEVLDYLCLTLESLASRPLRCSVMMADEAQDALRCIAAPSLPGEFRQKAAYAIRDGTSTCARAILSCRPVIVADAQKDDATEEVLAQRRRHGYGAIWSHPILQEGQVLGTLAFLPDAPGTPSAEDARLIEFGVQVARLALAHERHERALREAEQRFRDYAGLAADWFWEQDAGFRFTGLTYGPDSRPDSPPYYDQGIVGRQRWELPYVNVPEGFWDEHRRLLEAGQPFHRLRLQRRTDEGDIRHVEISGRPLFDEAGRLAGYRGVGRDITKRVLAADKSVAARKWLQLAVEAANVGLWERDIDTWEFRFSDNWKRLFGYGEDEIADSGEQFDRLVHPDDLERIHALARAYAALPEGEYRTRFRIRHRNGQWRWVLSRGSIVTDAADGRRHWMGCHVDITKLVEAQDALRESEQRVQELNATLEDRVLARTAELAAANQELDAFNFSVSHDLRAPLRAVQGFSEALVEDYAAQLDDAGRDYLGRIGTAAQRMARLIDAMYQLSRLSRALLQVRELSLTAVAEAVVEELRESEPARAVEVAIAHGLTAEGDADLLRIVLANLLGNAWKYTARTPRPRIEFGAGEDAQGRRVFFVRDNGAGFDMQFSDKLFRLFQRLHRDEEFGGYGVGLATVQRILRRHGGRIWAESEKGRGATFHFTLWEDAAIRREAEAALREMLA